MDHSTLFLDIDTQFDFLNPAGKLYFKDADTIIPNVSRLRKFANASPTSSPVCPTPSKKSPPPPNIPYTSTSKPDNIPRNPAAPVA